MKKLHILTFAAAALLCGCATTQLPDVATHTDSAGLRIDLIPENLLETTTPSRELLWLNASRVFKNHYDFDYFLEVHYEATPDAGFLQINPGNSLLIVADGNEIEFESRGSMNARRNHKGFVSEDALYLAGPNELRAIARAEKVVVQVTGQNGTVHREFGPANFQRFQKFVQNYVEGEADVPVRRLGFLPE